MLVSRKRNRSLYMKEKSADQAAEERYLVKIEQEYEKKRETKKSIGEIALTI